MKLLSNYSNVAELQWKELIKETKSNLNENMKNTAVVLDPCMKSSIALALFIGEIGEG